MHREAFMAWACIASLAGVQHRRVGSSPVNQLGARANAGSGSPALALLLSSCAT